MYFFREVEKSIAKIYPEGDIRCPTHLSIGQEAVPAAFSKISNRNDFAVSTHRGHLHYLAKGGNLNQFFSELFGKENGCSSGKGGSMHLIDLNVNFMGTSAILGNSIPLGVGLGLSIKQKKQRLISTIFFGEGATEEGVFYESLNFSALKKLPVLFICENNFYSVYSPLNVRQPKDRKIHKIAQTLGVKSKLNKSNDVISIYEDIDLAMKYIKKNKKPYFLEFETYRYIEHCGPNQDDNLGYRPLNEQKIWRKKDSLLKIEKYLLKNDKFFNIRKNKINKQIDRLIIKSLDHASKSKEPKLSSAFMSPYAK
ncbi:thiamine pyrophosphate-dependent dehydrogenase E1 component subunit alpha [Alphaproteobacteria bacterium]|nr:thiamine pyrophosphate-dependent dehydrogenase E1 component subunit alpha [Alphaproteobacteria bacterium]